MTCPLVAHIGEGDGESLSRFCCFAKLEKKRGLDSCTREKNQRQKRGREKHEEAKFIG